MENNRMEEIGFVTPTPGRRVPRKIYTHSKSPMGQLADVKMALNDLKERLH